MLLLALAASAFAADPSVYVASSGDLILHWDSGETWRVTRDGDGLDIWSGVEKTLALDVGYDDGKLKLGLPLGVYGDGNGTDSAPLGNAFLAEQDAVSTGFVVNSHSNPSDLSVFFVARYGDTCACDGFMDYTDDAVMWGFCAHDSSPAVPGTVVALGQRGQVHDLLMYNCAEQSVLELAEDGRYVRGPQYETLYDDGETYAPIALHAVDVAGGGTLTAEGLQVGTLGLGGMIRAVASDSTIGSLDLFAPVHEVDVRQSFVGAVSGADQADALLLP